jgi:hypothetical protein
MSLILFWAEVEEEEDDDENSVFPGLMKMEEESFLFLGLMKMSRTRRNRRRPLSSHG